MRSYGLTWLGFSLPLVPRPRRLLSSASDCFSSCVGKGWSMWSKSHWRITETLRTVSAEVGTGWVRRGRWGRW